MAQPPSPSSSRGGLLKKDYVSDPRIASIALSDLREFLTSKGVEPQHVQAASTKFGLISLAEDKSCDLEELLAPIDDETVLVRQARQRQRDNVGKEVDVTLAKDDGKLTTSSVQKKRKSSTQAQALLQGAKGMMTTATTADSKKGKAKSGGRKSSVKRTTGTSTPVPAETPSARAVSSTQGQSASLQLHSPVASLSQTAATRADEDESATAGAKPSDVQLVEDAKALAIAPAASALNEWAASPSPAAVAAPVATPPAAAAPAATAPAAPAPAAAAASAPVVHELALKIPVQGGSTYELKLALFPPPAPSPDEITVPIELR